jgi:hypothetical protein
MLNHYAEQSRCVGKLPYEYYQDRLDILERYIQLSPALRYLRSQRALLFLYSANGIKFYTNDSYCWDYIMDVYDDNNRFIPLVVFLEEMSKEKKLNQPDQCPESTQLLRRIRQLRGRPDWNEGPTEEEF